jgi:hypothetical protein
VPDGQGGEGRGEQWGQITILLGKLSRQRGRTKEVDIFNEMELRRKRRENEEMLEHELEQLSVSEARTIQKLGWSQDDVNRFLKDFNGVG